MGKPNMPNNQVIQNLHHQLATEVQRYLDIVNASVAELIDGAVFLNPHIKNVAKH